MDGRHSFSGNSYHSTHSVILSQQPLSFILFFFSEKTFQLIFMWLHKCKYICMQICNYVVMFVIPTSHNPLQGYFNGETLQLHQKVPDIVSQTISLFGAYGKFRCSLLQSYAVLCFMVCSKDFFIMIVRNMQTKVILTFVIFFKNPLVMQMNNSGYFQIPFRGR